MSLRTIRILQNALSTLVRASNTPEVRATFCEIDWALPVALAALKEAEKKP